MASAALTMPGPRAATGVGSGRRTPTSSTGWIVAACMNRAFEPVLSEPFTTRIELTTPRYVSKWLSKISAWSGAAGSPSGAGMRSITASSSSGTPSPVLAEMRRMSSAGMPSTCSISAAYVSGSAAGRSILLRQATISRSFSSAR